MSSELSIINRTYELIRFTIPICQELPKRWRFGLGASLEQSTYTLLEQLVLAKNAPQSLKATYLIKAQSHLEIVTFKYRLLLDLKLTNETKIFQAQAKLSEIGRMLGGWKKSVN